MNMDLVVTVGRSPDKGETITGKDFKQVPGGKGANQAVAAGKLGAEVSFLGACGRDQFGDILLASMAGSGVNVDNVYRMDVSTGIAAITVEDDGDNRIVVVPGANGALTPGMIDTYQDKIKDAAVILLQLEIPLETVTHIIELAGKHNTKVILDPAPAQKLPEQIYQNIDYFLPNQGELDLLLSDYNLATEEEKVNLLLRLGVGTVIVTKGKAGITLYKQGFSQNYGTVKVDAVDTTAAGDSFAGAFAFGLQQDWSEEKSIQFANLVAAFSVTKPGAQSSLPDMNELEEFRQKIQQRG